MPKHIKNSKLALIGLIILFAVSSLMAGGGKPKIEKASANLRPLSASEIMGILQSFPEMVPGFLKEDVFSKKDTLRLKRLFRFSELDNTLLKQIFSNARFYRGFDGKKPPHPYLMVVVENKRYSMPSNFNRLLLEHNLEVNDGNIIELAKAFVIIALEGKEITFLEGKRINKRVGSAGIYNAFVKIEIDDEIQEWYFRTGYGGQFWEVAVGYPATKKFYHQYHPLPAEKKIKEGGWDNSPQIKIELGYGGVYLELENNIYHYYLIVSKDGEPTKDSIKFLITGFPPDAKNVYIRAKSRDTTYVRSFLFERVFLDDNGATDTVWIPSQSLTGITDVTAGYADTSAANPKDTYQPDPLLIPLELTLEKVITGDFPNSEDDYKIYLSNQFFVFINNQVFSKIA